MDASTEQGAPATSAEPEARVVLEPAYRARVNFAMQQNGYAIVDHIAITNHSDRALEDLVVEASLASGVADPWTGRIDHLGPGSTYHLKPVGLEISPTRLREQTEREATELVVRARAGEHEVGSKRAPLEVLAASEWGGAEVLPELLAAFVTPNHPALEPLLATARGALETATGSGALDGYQSADPRRAANIGEALFGACAARRIGYSNPPASFELGGQRVRLADRALESGLATCLDLSLLLAGLWEQAGLHALVILLPGHALPAFWTIDEHFAEPVIDGALPVRKRVALGEIVPVESTLLTHENASFAEAVARAKQRLGEDQAPTWAVDVRAARKRRIRPIAQRAAPGVTGGTASPEGETGAPAAFTFEATPFEETGEAPMPPADRVDRWKRKLLDLSLRNRLINFKDTKRTAPLLCPDPARLEDLLADGKKFGLRHKPEARGPEVEQEEGGVEAFLGEELEAGRLYLDLTERETERRLLEMYRDSRSAIEETGANLLHLGLGTLTWYESASSEIARRAPLLLVPVRLDRRGAGLGFTLTLADEPPKPNVTLLQKLRAEFSIDEAALADLPEDEAGIDVGLILNRFRHAVKHIDRWEVTPDSHLGLFSFSKHLMWLDLEERTDDLRRSALVRKLLDGDGEAIDTSPFEPAHALDDEVAPGDLLCPRDADSSQMVAVRAASSGRTFVLQGPPGTGKSQTIANLIADALASGKRVLFVAEKRAALTVVRKRLGQDGLGPFCLELHSNRASKKKVLAQMGDALELAGAQSPSGWDETCGALENERDRLNGYVRELHARRDSGESVFEVIARLAGLGDGPRVRAAIEDVAATDEATLGAIRAAIERLARAADLVGGPATHPLRGVGAAEYSFQLPERASEAIERGIDRLDEAEQAVGAWADAALADTPSDADAATDRLSREGLAWLRAVAELLVANPRPNAGLLTEANWDALRASLDRWIQRGRARDATRASLLDRYRPELLERDLLAPLDTLRRRASSIGIVRWLTTRAVRKDLRPLCAGTLPPNAALIEDLERAIETQRETKALASSSEGLTAFGSAWRAGEADWDALAAQLEWVDRFRAALAAAPAFGDIDAHARLIDAATTKADRAAETSRAVIEALDHLLEAERSLDDALALTQDAWGPLEQPGCFATMRNRAAAWRDNLSRLPDWCHWRAACDGAPDTIAGLVRALETGDIEAHEASGAFERDFGERWVRATADRIEAIRSFTAGSHEQSLERFRDLDERVIELTKGVIRARLASRVPRAGSEVSDRSEMGLLRREMEKQRRHMPVRRLVQELPNLLPRIKPCFLMSPLSVAQYLDPSVPAFDLVVFDEASQIPVWDAIGAIARGSDVVVVGDSKQLPPTSFFEVMGEELDEDVPVEEEELESILQECDASGVPSLRLLWHYRSRHESLIAFSNHHYYENRLLTFPSPVDEPARLGVSMRHFEDGVYDRGNSRTNRVEAEAIADEVVSLLTDSSLRTPPTIGVVTFNLAQQRLIEDLLDARRRENPALEPFFSEGDEPVFVKNLENVQGDERDVILFSITYGPDETGRVSMNFGPLNRNGGERRLNVAITRARERVVVFSSITPDSIDLGRTDRIGVKHLKTFLDYARRGPRAIAEAAAPVAGGSFESPFERAVHDALTARGWSVDRQVGCSAYRIDLAVKHPEKPGRYLLGVECDGASYHSAATARDRDRIRQGVLERLGWRIHRVWSTDWFMDPARCLHRLEQALEAALRDEHAVEAPEPQADAQTVPGGSIGNAAAPVAPPGRPAPHAVPVYTPYRSRATARDREDYYAEGSLRRLAETLVRIVERESPVLMPLAMRRLAEAWGVERMTQRAQDRAMDAVLHAAGAGAIVRRGETLWSRSDDPESWLSWRMPGDGDDAQRDIEEIPVAERAAAAAHVLERQIALPAEELEREAARLLGVGRMSERSRDAMAEGIAHAVERGLAVRQGDSIAHPG